MSTTRSGVSKTTAARSAVLRSASRKQAEEKSSAPDGAGQDTAVSRKENKMLVTVLCLTYMMIIILIHAIWITSIIKHDGKCHYNDCGHCPYDGWCQMQEDRAKEAAHGTHRSE